MSVKSASRYLPRAALGVLLCVGMAACSNNNDKAAADKGSAASAASAASQGGARKGGGGAGPVAVGVAPVVQQDAPLQMTALGTVAAANTTTVRARVNGLLEKVYFQEGQFVRQGQLLATLDPRTAQAALMQAQGQLLRDQALLDNARRDLQRYQQLWAQDSIARQQVDTQAALVRQYQGTVKLDQGSVQNAQVQMDYTRVTAPVSGQIGLRQADPGNLVQTTDTNGIVVITQTQPINVVFSLPEGDLRRLQQAREGSLQLKAEAWSRDNTRKLAEGMLLAVDNKINASTGTVNLKARFANADNRLFPNQFVNVRLDLGSVAGAVMVPTAAIQMGKVGTYVYVVKNDQTVAVTAVKTGDASGTNTIVTEGLQPGQVVVVDGLDKLRDGASVQRVDRAAQAASAAAAGDGKGRGRRQGAASGAASDAIEGVAATAPVSRGASGPWSGVSGSHRGMAAASGAGSAGDAAHPASR